MSKIFNISSSNSFVDVLATKLLDEYSSNNLDLSNIIILLPNHRACRSLSDAFIHIKGMQPTLLPQIKAIGDISEDELILNGDENSEEFFNIPPSISPLERNLLFIKLIMRKYKEIGIEKISISQACFLANELGNLIDKAHLQELSWNNISNLVPDEYAIHWQETIKFLSIITSYWPKILQERGCIDDGERKNILIKKQCFLWQKPKTNQRIIIAGTTAVSPSMKLLVKTVLDLPNGEVYLSGLDKYIENDAWNDIDETHPQFEFKQLLDFLSISRHSVPDLVPPKDKNKEKLISEIMRPAIHSNKWRNLSSSTLFQAAENIKIIECKDSRLEALNIAIILRKILEHPTKTAALITPDRNLARRVTNELTRWQIDIDDSAGIPLSQTPWGIFMRLITKAFLPNSKKHEILALLKHKNFSLNMPSDKLHTIVRMIDKNCWRQNIYSHEEESLLQQIKTISDEFTNLFIDKQQIRLNTLLEQHIILAEKLSSNPNSSLWQNEDGQTGALFLAEWLEHSNIIGDINPLEYPELFESMMQNTTVHYKTKDHARIKILGPIEARLNHFDEIIIGGFNEGIWPTTPTADPWMSRPMKKSFGFEQPEKQIGVMALDFSNLLGAKQIYITRAKTSSGTPTIKSRWLMRLETVLQAININISTLNEYTISHLAEHLDIPKIFTKINSPNPKPPVKSRPRRLSASAFEKLLRDPYSVFAEYILQLKPLNELDQEITSADFGNVIHNVLEDFNNMYPTTYPKNAEEILIKIGKEAFNKSCFNQEKLSFWWPKFIKMMQWISAHEQKYRQQIKTTNNEILGKIFFDDAPLGRFEIYAKADRVDETLDNMINIIDYKTGQARKPSEIKMGFAPQLPIEGLIASEGGFKNINKAPIKEMMYWKLGDKIIKIDEDVEKIIVETKQHIKETINLFDFETTGYLSRPNPKNAPEYSDYEHLARVREWSVKDDEDE